MKKIILLLVSLLFTTNVYAFVGRECTSEEIASGKSAIKNVTYELNYDNEYINQDGISMYNHLIISFSNVPNGYWINFSDSGVDNYVISSNNLVSKITGGVHTLTYYSNLCDTPLQEIDVMIPSYKDNCVYDGNCEKEEIWMDKTEQKVKENISHKEDNIKKTILIIVASALLIVAIALTAVFLKKRGKQHEKSI